MLSCCCTVSKSVGNEVGVKKCEVDNNVMEVTVKLRRSYFQLDPVKYSVNSALNV